MANFMGPMAPPQAAPSTPPQLDIRTNPGQRAQFKEFMQSMNRPVMPPTTAPIAPMLPAPMSSPMDQIDIFAPVPMANPAPMPMPMPAPMPMQGGIMGAVPFEDGGPVGMFLGGDPQAYGEERGRQDTSETARERVGGTTNVFEGDSTPGGGDDDGDSTSQAVNQAVAAAQQAEDKAQLLEDMAASQKPVDLTFSAPRTDTSGRFTGTDTDEFFANQNMARDRALDDAVKSIIAVNKTQQFDDTLGDFFVDPVLGVDPVAPPVDMPGADPLADILAGEPGTSGAGDDSFSMRQGRLFDSPVVYNRGKDNERTLSRLADLENRMGIKDARVNKGKGLSGLAEPIVSKIASATGGAMATNIFDNVVNKGKTPIIASDTNQIVGYIGDGLFGKVYTGRPDYNPFGAGGGSYTVEEGTGAYIVDRQQPNQGDSDERAPSSLPRALQPLPAAPAQPPAAPPPPNMIVRSPDTGTPATPPDVVVPSPRDPVTVNVPSLIAPNIFSNEGIAPMGTVPTFLPQSFLDMLASFNRPAPRAMQDGGAVLDKAADDFLEALRVA